MGSIEKKILFVFKNYTYDPCLHALKRWIKKLNNNTIYFEFTETERPRGISKKANKRLVKLLRNNRFAIIIVWNPLLNFDELYEIKKNKSINIIMLNGFTALHSFNFQSQIEFFNYLSEFDGYFIPMEEHINKLKKFNINAYYSPFFVDPFKYKKIKLPKFINTLFVGEVNQNWAINRYKFLAEISKKYKPLILSQSKHNIKNSYKVRAIPLEYIINFLHNISKVVFGSDYLPSVDPYNKLIKKPILLYNDKNLYTVRARVFTVMSSASAYVSEYHPEINKLFENEKEIMLWNNYEELNYITDKLTNDKQLNKKISLNGYKATLNNHTIFHRLNSIEKIFSIKLFTKINLNY